MRLWRRIPKLHRINSQFTALDDANLFDAILSIKISINTHKIMGISTHAYFEVNIEYGASCLDRSFSGGERLKP